MNPGQNEVVVIEAQKREIRFNTGPNTYTESLLDGRWVGRFGRIDDRDNSPGRCPAKEAFSILFDGEQRSAGWQWESARQTHDATSGGQVCTVGLTNSILPVSVKIHTKLDGSPVLVRWLEITNNSEKSLALTELSPMSGRLWSGTDTIAIGHIVNPNWAWEGWFGWETINEGMNRFENTGGLTWDEPFFVLRNDTRDEYAFGQLEWPVNFEMEFEKSSQGLTFKLGPIAEDALRVIAAGESTSTPALHFCLIQGSFDDAVQAMHEHIRRSVSPLRDPELAYRVQYLFPEDQPRSHFHNGGCNEEKVNNLIDVAAAVGVEVFILDGPTWAEGYGDWRGKKEWFPNGIKALRDYAHERGVLFGIYSETEGGRGDWSGCAAYQEHPEWFETQNFGFFKRLNNILRLHDPEVERYVASEATRIIEENQLDLFRHDMNSIIERDWTSTVRDGIRENNYLRYYEAVHRIFKHIHKMFPELILQQASAGGARLDLGTAGLFHEHYSSDGTGKQRILGMSSGLSVFLPPEILVTPHGMSGDVPDYETLLRCVYALGNTPFIFNSILPAHVDQLTPGIKDRFLAYNNLYRDFIRPLLATSRVYHHAPVSCTGGSASGDWFAMEFMAPDRSKGWATIVRIDGDDAQHQLLPRGVEGRSDYSITFHNTGEIISAKGSDLLSNGLVVRLAEGGPESELLLFESER